MPDRPKSPTVTSNTSTTSTTVRPALTYDGDDDPEPIWNLPTLDKFQFFAAAHYLSRVQRNQERRPRTWSKTDYTNPKATDIEKKLLDGIALLFARVKQSKDKNRQAKASAQHVTATAIRKTDKGLTIYIAKNDGPKTVSDIGDEDFAEDLCSWFNKKTDDSIRQRMQEFWKARRQYYLEQIPLIWKKMEASVHLQHDLLSDYEKIGLVDGEEFLADWNGVISHMVLWTSPSSGTIDFDTPDLDSFTEIGRQNYPESCSWQINELQDLTNHFRKLVKYIRLFGTVPRIWRTFLDFRSYVEGKQVRFEFIKRQGSFSINSGPILAAIDSWNGVQWNLDDKMKNQVVEEIRKQKVINRYFHCELQLLEKFISAKDVVDYFGCSKLSCFMCWGILNGSPYRTKNTHAKIYPACAFPFALTQGVENFELVLALKKVQDHLLERVLRRVLDPDHTYTQYKCWSETDLHETLSSIGSNGDREVLQIAQPESLQSLLQPALPLHSKQVQVIQIPQNDSPKLVPVTLHNTYGQKHDKFYNPFAKSDEREEYWISDMDLDTDARWYTLFLESPYQTETERYTTKLDFWLFHRLRGDSGEYLQDNKWCMDAVHDKIDPANEQFPWKGDLYLFANVDEVGNDHRTEDIPETDSSIILQSFCCQFCLRWKSYSKSVLARARRHYPRIKAAARSRIYNQKRKAISTSPMSE
ncbi:MAG: hypothetical protein Q9165_007916 [Trypethelium subeluteriae]